MRAPTFSFTTEARSHGETQLLRHGFPRINTDFQGRTLQLMKVFDRLPSDSLQKQPERPAEDMLKELVELARATHAQMLEASRVTAVEF
jgi:hypothetical protein